MIAPARPFSPPRFGQAIALAAPAGALEAEALAAGLDALREILPEAAIRMDDAIHARLDYLAGEDSARALHLSGLMQDPAVGAVLAARGGFGCSRLLPLLDLPALVAAGHLFIGSSDLTCLVNALAQAGLVAVHGPLLIQLPRLDQPSRDELAALLRGQATWPATLQGQPLSPGRAQGPLLGGNLTMLCHLLGTPWFPDLERAILFIEDLNEAPYRLDRLLTQLELAGVLDRVAGVAVGALSDQAEDPPQATEAVARRLGGLPVPVVMGLPLGHGPANRSLPVGAMAELDGQTGTLTVGLGYGPHA